MNFEAFAVNRDLFSNDDMQVEEGLLDGLSRYVIGLYSGMIDICLKLCAASALKAPAASSCAPIPLPIEISCNVFTGTSK